MQDILEEFMCPVCVNYMVPPIRTCIVGHSFCNRCDRKLMKCPICREGKFGARNYGMENVFSKLIVPCKNVSEGCSKTVRGTDLREHQIFCHYTTKACPLRTIRNCMWKGQAKNIFDHCLERHSDNVYSTNRMQLIYPRFKNGNLWNPTETGDCYHMLFQAYDELFKCVWDIDTNTRFMRWCVACFGPMTSADKYYFEVVFHNAQNPESKPIYERARCQAGDVKNFQRNRYILTNIDMLRNASGWRGMHYTVSIYKFEEGVQQLHQLPTAPIAVESSEDLNSSFVVPEPSLYFDANDPALHEVKHLLLLEVSDSDNSSDESI